MLAKIDDYERYCEEHPEYPNNRAVLAIENIVQLSLNTIKSAGYVRINCFTNGFCQCRPRVDFEMPTASTSTTSTG